jgi:Ino eighty subunit 2
MPSSKLREATSGGAKEAPPAAPYSRFQPGPIVSGPRGTRAKRAVVIDSGSEDDEDEDDEEEEDDQEDAEDDDEAEEEEEVEDEAGNEEVGSDEDAEGEEEDAEGDEDAEGSSEEAEAGNGIDTPMEDAAPPPPPKIRMTGPSSKPSLTVTPAVDGKVKSVEAKEMQGSTSDDDEELSELESTNEAEEGEGGEEDAEGEEVGDEDQDMDQDQDQDDDDEDMDSDEDGTPADGSRASTPDVSKMTKRQRSRLDQVMGSDFLQLPMGRSIPNTSSLHSHSLLITHAFHRTTDQKALNRGRTRHAPRRNGPSP